MKRFLLVLVFLLLSGVKAHGQAANIFITSSGAPSGVCSSGVQTPAFFNNPANWGAGGTQIGPGTVVHLCGTFTFPLNATGVFSTQGNGTSGHPITILFESGAIIQSPAFAFNGAFLINNSFITIDGGTNGIIQNTNAGTGMSVVWPPAGGGSTLITVFGVDTVTIKNLHLLNGYVHVPPDENGYSSHAIRSNGGYSNLTIGPNNTISQFDVALAPKWSGGELNLRITGNFLSNNNQSIEVNYGNDGEPPMHNITIDHNTHIQGSNWDDDPTNNNYHHNFFHPSNRGNTPSTATSILGTLLIYDNIVKGAMGASVGAFSTSFIFLETGNCGTCGDEFMGPWYIFNNVFYRTDNYTHGGSGLVAPESTAGFFLNNTIIQSGDQPGGGWESLHLYNSTGWTVQNNVWVNGSTYEDVSSAVTQDDNVFFGGVNVGGTGLWISRRSSTVTPNTLSGWQALCACDANSVTTDPLINTSTFSPGTGSSAISRGTNLTSMGIANLNSDLNGNPRPASGPWTAGAVNFSGSAPALSMSPNPAAFGSVNVGSNSSPITVTVTSTGSSTATLGSPVATFSDPQFVNAGGGTCVINQSLPVGSSCTIVIRFTPSSAGAKSGTMLAGANTSASINLSGTGVSLTPVVSISPSPVPFGSITTGTTSGAQTVTVTNTGTATLTLANPFFVISGTNAADYSRTGGTCANSGTVAASASCTLTMTFHPTTVGAKTGVLTINGNATGTANLTGTGVAPSAPIVTISPIPVAFGNQVQSTTSSATTVTVTNTGAATLTLATPFFVFAGANPTNFVRSGGTCADAGTVAASASCTILVTFTPNILGARSATLTINGNATGSVSLTGTGIAPATPVVSISPSPIAFGNQTQGTTSSALTVTVSNTGSASLVLNTPFFTLTGTNASDFARTGGTCTNGGTVVVSSSCTVLLTFTPPAVGARSGTLNISGNVNGSAPISGTGVAVSTTSMSATPTSWNFGTVPQGTTSTPKQFTITNTGTTSLTLAGPPFTTFSGANPADFMLGTGGGDTCSSGTVLTAGQTCTKTLQGVPSIVGAESATVTFNATTTTATASLTMTGQSTASLLITPRPVAFPTTIIGTTSAAVTATITNSGGVSETLATPFFTLTGTNAADFTKTGGSCSNGLVLAAAATCTVTLTFTPTINGAETSNLTVTSNLASNLVAVNGTGAIPTPLPGIALSPSGGVSFGNQVVGTTSSIQTVTVSSTGTGNLTLNTPYFTITGTNAADVTNTGAGSCVNGGTLAPGSTCTITLAFNPAGAGARTATLNVNGNASATLPITGTGVAQVVTLTAAPSPVDFGNVTQSTVSATQTVTITNAGNVTATLATPYYTLTGANSADFANLGTGSCANGGSLAVAATCTIKVTFTPSLLAAETATLTVNGSLGSTVNDALTGTGVAPLVPSINLSPNPVAFPNTNVGSTSTGITVTVSNNGSATLNLSTPFYTVSGANPLDFTRSAGTCINGGTVAVSASCTIVISFAPAVAGAESATLNISGNASQSVNMTGTGVATAAILTLTPNPLNYGVVIQGSSSITTMTLQNTGTAQTTLLTPFLSITGANAGDFTRLGGSCVNGQILLINGSCSIIVAFTPSTNTAETATLSVFGASVTGSATLNGTGQARPNLPAPSVLIISKRWVRSLIHDS